MTERIEDYKLVSKHEHAELEKDVKEAIKDGWKPLGGVSVVVPVLDGAPAPLFAQALVKTDSSLPDSVGDA